MNELHLHFRITLAPEDEPFRSALEDDIDRRWSWRDAPHRKHPLISTVRIEPGDETRIEIEGWPACRTSIRAHLLKLLAAWRDGREDYRRR